MGKQNFIAQAKKIVEDRHKSLQETVLDNRKKALENKEFAELNQRKRELIFEIGKSSTFNLDKTKLEKELENATKKQEIILKKLNLSFDDLKETYQCKKCMDSGYKDSKMCECLKTEISTLLLDNSNLNKRNLPSFSDVDYSLYSEEYVANIKNIYNRLEKYALNMQNENAKIVTIVGGVGVGKTFLTECIVNSAINSGNYTVYTTSASWNNDMLKCHISPFYEKEMILEPYLTCDLLIIDDLGTEPTYNNVTKEYLYLIISERLKNNLNTIINTNLSLQQILDVYGERIFSRLANVNSCMLIQMQANDIRLGLRR